MACSDFSDPLDFLTNMNGTHAMDAIICPFTTGVGTTGDGLGMPTFALVVFGVMLTMYWLSERSIAVPLVIIIMLGFLIVPLLPGVSVTILVLLFMVGGPISVLYLIHRLRQE